ncbi:SpoIIIAH-like family protein [Lachnoclostridium sp. An196]|uniref:SpoIIIAH-like family protein n=1 Tax=Lachnoclostridium sp. An196 TaxID=1965583 RepID=UPI001FA8DA7D|nr:SpoIIIAH-like family protein [Lachnoclostridium sp. An196]
MKQIFKKPVFKKNQMIITALAAMIAVAGYLNYSGTGLDEDLLSANSSAIEDTEDASVAEDISAEDIYAQTGTEETGDIASLDEDTEAAEEEAEPAAEEQAEAEVGDTVMVGSSVGVGLVSEAKVTREQTRSRNKEILMELINSTNITDEQKQGAIDEMVEMTDIAEKELAAETLLSAQGFNDVVVSINESSADVVVSNTQVSDAERAQIEDIVKRKTGIEAANITITPVTAAE